MRAPIRSPGQACIDNSDVTREPLTTAAGRSGCMAGHMAAGALVEAGVGGRLHDRMGGEGAPVVMHSLRKQLGERNHGGGRRTKPAAEPDGQARFESGEVGPGRETAAAVAHRRGEGVENAAGRYEANGVRRAGVNYSIRRGRRSAWRPRPPRPPGASSPTAPFRRRRLPHRETPARRPHSRRSRLRHGDGVQLRRHHADRVAGRIQHRPAAVPRPHRRGDPDQPTVVAGAGEGGDEVRDPSRTGLPAPDEFCG